MIAKPKHSRISSLFCEIGRPLKYEEYVSLGNKRHYWDNPNKNFGFLTSEQIEERSRRMKTEGVYDCKQQYQSVQSGSYIVSSRNPQKIHCCTCHNNPRRYINSEERCQFCEQHSRHYQPHSLVKSGIESIKKEERKPRMQMKDQVIQVSLPRVRHNQKQQDKCTACKDKKTSKLDIKITPKKAIHNSAKKVLKVHYDGSTASKSRRRNIASNLQF